MGWRKMVFVLGVYGFFKEFRPSEHFVSPFLNGPHKNFTEEQINQEIFPVATYSNLSLLVIIFLLTDWLKYKPVIIMGGIAGMITMTILPLGQSIRLIQVSQFFYGFMVASDVAYYSYMYAKVEKKYYQRATSITKAVILVGKASSGLASQALLHFHLMDYLELNYLTLGALTLSTCWAFFFPAVSHNDYNFHKEKSNSDVGQQVYSKSSETEKMTEKTSLSSDEASKAPFSEKELEDKTESSKLSNIFVLIRNLKAAASNKEAVTWSLWWSASLCGSLQVVYYIQLLWQSIINNSDKNQPIYHGYISTAHCVIGAICTYLVGFLKLRWDIFGELTLALCSIIQGCLILQITRINVLLINYVLFICFRTIYQASNAIASSEIAKHIHSESYALVFGINTFIALLAQTILTVVVIDYLELDIRTQFTIYGAYYVIIGVVFALFGLHTIISHYRRGEKNPSIQNI
ncbi:hypothetical protein RUM43_007077 [Polyplax serrata]|uniref:Thiamine transporter 2 n=1 Tax=Polyplax serrata TaxID=468196 RepID=A0AAN8S172_POLSC